MSIPINTCLALLLAIYILRNRNIHSLILGVFIYSSLHFAYAVLPLFSSGYYGIKYLHQCRPADVKAAGGLFVLFTLGLVIWRYRRALQSGIKSKLSDLMVSAVILWLAAVLTWWAGNAVNQVYPSTLAIQDIASAFLMLILVWSLATALNKNPKNKKYDLKAVPYVIMILLLLMTITAFWEVFSGAAFERNWTHKYQMHFCRAAALLFNPNVLGFWYAFTAIIAAYAFHTSLWARRVSIAMLLLASVGLLLSGSRTAFLTCLFMFLFTALLLLKMPKNITRISALSPSLVFLGGLSTTMAAIKTLPRLGDFFRHFIPMNELVDRIIYIPWVSLHYIISKLPKDSPIRTYQMVHNLSEPSDTVALAQSADSIAGRFSIGGIADNGYLAMLEDGGLATMLIWIILWCAFIWLGIRALKKAPTMNSVYSLAIILGCAITGLFMRAFQVFPVWVILALVLAYSLAWIMCVLEKDPS